MYSIKCTAWDGSSAGQSPGRKISYAFLPGHRSRADRSENLHDCRALYRTWISALLVATPSCTGLQMAGSKWYFLHKLSSAYRGRFVSQTRPLKHGGQHHALTPVAKVRVTEALKTSYTINYHA